MQPKGTRLLLAGMALLVALGVGSTALAADPAAGKAVYTKNCAACHGANAEGGVGPSLKEHKPPVAEVKEMVRKGSPVMPPFSAAQISDADLENLVAYLLSIGAAKEEGAHEEKPAAPPALPKSGGLPGLLLGALLAIASALTLGGLALRRRPR